jgi:uncharacterized membrane protein YgdD (TMEM256/DUF423 family)
MDHFNNAAHVATQIAADVFYDMGSIVRKLGISKFLYVEGPEVPPPPPPSAVSSIGNIMLAIFGETSPWIRVAGLSGAIAVSLGAYGAHGLKKMSDDQKMVFETANRYHFIHTLAMFAVPMTNRPNLVGSLLLAGIAIFSGSCYVHGVTGDERIIRLTPYGGMLLISAWLSMIF